MTPGNKAALSLVTCAPNLVPRSPYRIGLDMEVGDLGTRLMCAVCGSAYHDQLLRHFHIFHLPLYNTYRRRLVFSPIMRKAIPASRKSSYEITAFRKESLIVTLRYILVKLN